MFADENVFEEALVRRLEEELGWRDKRIGHEGDAVVHAFDTGRRRVRASELVENWRHILSAINSSHDRLGGDLLTDDEMEQVLCRVGDCRSAGDANLLLNQGMSIEHDGHDVSLSFYDRDSIVEGKAFYQVVRQAHLGDIPGDSEPGRCGDVLLLVNGIPVAEVELKRDGKPVTAAVTQIEKYVYVGAYESRSGDERIYQMVQVFAAMTPYEGCVYFANPGKRDLNAEGHMDRRFAFSWANSEGVKCMGWSEFAEGVLSIPMMHHLLGWYSVVDGSDGDRFKVMRPYQYWAARKICDSVLERTQGRLWGCPWEGGGYVWHATGSGKTLTSFKVAQLLAHDVRYRVDKVLFLVDRRDLSTQSVEAYRGFSSRSDSYVHKTSSSGELARLLAPTSSARIIVTSIQKCHELYKRRAGLASEGRSGGYVAHEDMHVVIMCDECHRSVNGSMMRGIRETFPHAVIFGFTGTPRFRVDGADNVLSTEEIFGRELHRYTVANAIEDGNVLGFNLSYGRAYDVEDVLEAARDYAHRDINDVREAEEVLPREFWECEAYRREVVRDIAKCHRRMRPARQKSSIFATSRISDAIAYWRLFREMYSELDIAVVFSDDDEGSDFAERVDAKRDVLEWYRDRYGLQGLKSFGDDYFRDVVDRLAHRGAYCAIDRPELERERLDIVIVVDQLLTGFDAKWVGALFLDKWVEGALCIQAFSRTNRLLGGDGGKKFGIIRWYRKPHLMKDAVDDAMRLYSGDRVDTMLAPDIAKNVEAVRRHLPVIESLFTVDGVLDYASLPDRVEDCARFVREFKSLSDALELALVQGARFSDDVTIGDDDADSDEHPIMPISSQDYRVLAMRRMEAVNHRANPDAPDITDFDIDMQLAVVDVESIDKSYLERHFADLIARLRGGYSQVDIEATLAEIHSQFARLSHGDQVLAQMLIDRLCSGEIEVGDLSFDEALDLVRDTRMNERLDKLCAVLGFDDVTRERIRVLCGDSDPKSQGRLDGVLDAMDRGAVRAWAKARFGLGSWRAQRLARRLVRAFVASDDGVDVDEWSERVVVDDPQ